MKIAITADLHLRRKDETPERYLALESILREIKERAVNTLIIAGDLFDRDFSNYSDFDSLCREYLDLKIIAIPGNHDYQIERRFFSSPNIEVISKPQLIDFEGVKGILIPYSFAKSLDEALVEYFHQQSQLSQWILIAHGDYITSSRVIDQYETGLYMPLTHSTINRLLPRRVFLGHIHKPSNFGKVFYPGSPCSINVTETGKRRFIIYDTYTDTVEEIYLSSQKLYFIESLLLTPYNENEEILKDEIEEMVKGWGLTDSETKRVSLRLSLKGYTSDFEKTVNSIRSIIESYGISLFENQIETSELKLLRQAEPERIFLFEKIRESIEELNFESFKTNKEKVLEKAMELIFH